VATLNYTSGVAATKTAAEIQQLLAAHGAAAVMVRYVERAPAAVSFTLSGPHGDRAFTLPVDVDAMFASLKEQGRRREIPPRYATREQAERTAWRVVKDWLAAQVALVAAGMAALDQVMLPYLHVDGETTLYQAYQRNDQRALTAANR
jgi:hypothetical protein